MQASLSVFMSLFISSFWALSLPHKRCHFLPRISTALFGSVTKVGTPLTISHGTSMTSIGAPLLPLTNLWPAEAAPSRHLSTHLRVSRLASALTMRLETAAILAASMPSWSHWFPCVSNSGYFNATLHLARSCWVTSMSFHTKWPVLVLPVALFSSHGS